ncbi:MAG: protease complex subunit PrcB family protein [Firmicutes bacterium]|nr:protease complex subunit PrcB family protein [Bacillota bacterium]
MRMRLFVFVILLTAILLSGCGRQTTPPPQPAPPGQDEPLPAAIQAWIEDSRTMFLAQSRTVDDTLYLLVTYGERPTGGYEVEIGEVVAAAGKISVPVRFKKPAPGEIVTQALTYPYDLIELEARNLPVEFVPSGDEEYLPALVGIDELLPIVAGSTGIKLFAPAPESVVTRKFVLEGVANVFEGNVQYKLQDRSGRLLDSGYTTGSMGDWGYFRAELLVPGEIAAGERLLLDVFTESAKDGSLEQQILYEIVLE